MLTPLAAVGLAVLLHVAWNLLARRSPPEANFLWWIVGLHVLLFAPFTLADFIRAAEQASLLSLSAAITGIANGVYFVAFRFASRLRRIPNIRLRHTDPKATCLRNGFLREKTRTPLNQLLRLR